MSSPRGKETPDERIAAKKNHPAQLKKQISEVEYLNLDESTMPDQAGGSSASDQQSTPTSNMPSTSGRSVAAAAATSYKFDNRNSQRLDSASKESARRDVESSSSSSPSGPTDVGPTRTLKSDSTQRLTGIDEVDGNSDDGTYQSIETSARNSTLRLPGSKLTRNLAWTVLASTLGSSFQHGYNGGVVNAPEKLISRFINDTYQARHGEYATDSQLDLVFAIIVSIFCIGGCIGALMTPLVADRIGRKQGLLYNNVIVLIACPLMAGAKFMASYELLIVGRLLIGINAGLNAGLAPLYMNEISPANLRGALGTVYQLVITIAILLSNIFGLPDLFGTEDRWSLLFAIPILPAIFMLFTLPNCHESPKHLLLNRGHELQAQQALAWFRETGEVQDEIEELKLEQELSKLWPPISLSEMLRQQNLRKPLTIAIVIMLSQQFSGINAVLFYSTSIFRSAGLNQHSAIRATLGMSLVNVLMTVVSLFLVDRAGRRTLHMTGLMGMCVTSIVLALCLGSQPDETAVHGSASSLLAVVSIYTFIMMFASGPGSIPWFLVAELFPSNARPLAAGIAVAVNWLANFTVSLCFLPLSNILHGYTFFVFAILLLIFYLFTYYKVPETKGATAEEISALFKR